VRKKKGNGNVSVVMCAGLLQGGGDGGKCKFFIAGMYFFSTG
jgi:hypothetical protein